MVGAVLHGDVEMSTIYVLMEEGWEYNDETYFHPHSGGGTPHSFYTKESDAQAECDKRNLASFKKLWKSGDIHDYCYGFDELVSYDLSKNKGRKKTLSALLEKIFGKDFEEMTENFYNRAEFQIESDSDEDWKALMSHIKLNFWEVVPVQKG